MRYFLAVIVFFSIVLFSFGTANAQIVQHPLQDYEHVSGCDFLETCNPNFSGQHLGEDAISGQRRGTLVVGTPVYAAADGEVKFAAVAGNFGPVILIESNVRGEWVVFEYGHIRMRDIQAHTGNTVLVGALLGYLGARSENGGFDPHLHFAVHKGRYQPGNSCDGNWNYAGYSTNPCVWDDWYDPSCFIEMTRWHAAPYRSPSHDTWLFNGGSLEGWCPHNISSVSFTPAGHLVLDPAADPRLESPPLSFAPADLNYLKFYAKNDSRDSAPETARGTVYFRSEQQGFRKVIALCYTRRRFNDHP